MGDTEKSNTGQTGCGPGSIGGAVAVVGHTDGNIAEGRKGKGQQPGPKGIFRRGRRLAGGHCDDYKKDTVDCLKQGVMLKPVRCIGDQEQRSQSDHIEDRERGEKWGHR